MMQHKPVLIGRPKSKPEHWWEPIWPRKDLVDAGPRILTKMFGSIDFAAPDVEGTYLPLQAYAWLPNWQLLSLPRDPPYRAAVLRYYTRILNSRLFLLLRREFSTSVAGGQLDVAPKYINNIPFPIITPEAIDSELMQQFERPLDASSWNDRLTANAYGTKIEDWPVLTRAL